MSSLPKTALAILALPGVESLEREPDGWCCHLAHGWTTDALSGGGTIIDTNLKTIRAYVVGAYQIADAEPETLASPATVAAPVALPLAVPSSSYICQGSPHGTHYKGWGGAMYGAPASALACPLADRGAMYPPVSQTIERRRWIDPSKSGRACDETGARFI